MRRQLDSDEPGEASGPEIPGQWQCGAADIGWAFLERHGCLCRQKIALVSALRGVLDCVDKPGGTLRSITPESIIQARATVARVETKKKGHI